MSAPVAVLLLVMMLALVLLGAMLCLWSMGLEVRNVWEQRRRQPLVDDVLWQRIQDVLAGRRIAGDRSWRHTHYLKGALRCARCGSRIGYGTAKGHGGDYDYFFCLGRHTKRTTCDLPYLPVPETEQAVERQWLSSTAPAGQQPAKSSTAPSSRSSTSTAPNQDPPAAQPLPRRPSRLPSLR